MPPKTNRKRRERVARHRKSLPDQLEDPASNGIRPDEWKRKNKRPRDEPEEVEDELVTTKLSNRILKEARLQQEEMNEDEDATRGEPGTSAAVSRGLLSAALQRLGDSDSDDEDGGAGAWDDGESLSLDLGGDMEITADDERALAAFMAPDALSHKQTNLSDLIMARLRERQAEQGLATIGGGGDGPEGSTPVPEGLDDKVVEVYRGVGRLLSRYTSGKVPKAFKLIPKWINWEEILFLTEPESWSVHAVYQATRIFVSNLNSRLAQRFLALVLLPRVRAEIREHKRLHFVLFQALRKATYKPDAFFKGLLLPLCTTRTCTLREAVIFSSVLKRSTLPALHSAAALLRMADLDYCGTTSFFMRVLLDKKYALPYRVIDSLVDHFSRFADDERQMPVVWHQSLLCFVQRYRDQVRPDDIRVLRRLCDKQNHYQVTPEVQRELDHSKARGQQSGGPVAMTVQTVVGKHVAEDLANMAPVPMVDD